jgi:methionyl-tRNA formyltransferase
MRIVFMGTPQAAVPTLERIIADGHEVVAVWTQPDRPSGRGNKLTFSPVKACATAHDIPVFQPEKVRTAETLELFQSAKADVAVVVAYGRILPETFLESFPKGCINVHFSLLPKYRGAAPVNRAIVNGEKTTGITTMNMDIGLDTGDILLQSKTEIGEEETTIDLLQRLSFDGANLLSVTLTALDEIIPRPQNHELHTLAPIMKKEDGKIDWSFSAAEITNRVRGFQPFPTSYTFWNGKKITIWKCNPIDEGQTTNDTGQIAEAKGDNLIVSCGKQTLLQIDELQIEGKRRMTTRDFLNGVKIQIGEHFE